MRRLGWIVELDDRALLAAVDGLKHRLADAGYLEVPPDKADVVVVWADHPLPSDLARAITEPRVRLVLAGPTVTSADPERTLAEAAGIYVAGTTRVHDVRVRGGQRSELSLSGHEHTEGDHVGRHDHVTDRVTLIDKTADDVEVLRSAHVGLDAHPIMTWRPRTSTAVWTLGTIPTSVEDRTTTRALIQLLRRVTGEGEPPAVRVGLLGYGAIGHEHSRAVRSVDGLELTAVCDTSAARLESARTAAPGIVTTTNADDLLARDDVDLVVVSTPPSTHAAWALRAIRAGKHVVVEKPFAIRTAEADDVMAEAEQRGKLAVVYQNRRFDADHLAVRRAVSSGSLGEVFHVETFVGGYGHPCNLWHSDEGVSGGAFYDWGSHVLDQILDIVPTEVEHVTAASHKRHWFDVTNADHSRVTIRFVDGRRGRVRPLRPRRGAQAAVVRPGHRGRARRPLAHGDGRVAQRHRDAGRGRARAGGLTSAARPATRRTAASLGSRRPLRPPYEFHRELADRLRVGLPMTVTAAQSRRVLSVMEAARRSAEDSGRPVVPR